MEWIENINIDTTIWSSLILPVAAAILTTLIVEYFAKPKLEARKTRLVNNRQQLDEVIYQFQKTSLAFGALLADERRHAAKERHNSLMLEDAFNGLQDIRESISRLSHGYVEKHSDHISKTSIYIGYLLSQVDAAMHSKMQSTPIDDLKKDAEQLSHFDTYFLANINVGDGQERWFRRLYWRFSTKPKVFNKVNKVLQQYNLNSEYRK